MCASQCVMHQKQKKKCVYRLYIEAIEAAASGPGFFGARPSSPRRQFLFVSAKKKGPLSSKGHSRQYCIQYYKF